MKNLINFSQKAVNKKNHNQNITSGVSYKRTGCVVYKIVHGMRI